MQYMGLMADQTLQNKRQMNFKTYNRIHPKEAEINKRLKKVNRDFFSFKEKGETLMKYRSQETEQNIHLLRIMS